MPFSSANANSEFASINGVRWLHWPPSTWSVGPVGPVGGPLDPPEDPPHEMRASMLHDLVAGNRLEAPWLCGAVVRLGREARVPTPANAMVLAAMKPYAEGSGRAP